MPSDGMTPTHDPTANLVLFDIDGFHLALDATVVERVVLAAEIAPVPELPRGVRGVVNVRGKVLPVLDLRERLRLPAREIRSTDHFIVLRCGGRPVALMVDDVTGVVPAANAAVVEAPAVLPGLTSVEGWVKVNSELILIHDVEKFLTTDEMAALGRAMGA